jgi:hypothetical protein
MNNKLETAYSVGPGKPPRETQFKKGQVANPNGRRGKAKEPEVDLGKVLQLIDNEKITVKVDGKRKKMTKAEVHYVQLFTRSLRGEISAARIIADMAALYFGAEAQFGQQIVFQVMPNEYFDELYSRPAQDNSSIRKGGKKHFAPIQTIYPGGTPSQQPHQISAAATFRKVALAKISVELDGRTEKMIRWHAFIRQLYNQALNKNNYASRLIAKLRKQFPGASLPGEFITYIMTEADAKL